MPKNGSIIITRVHSPQECATPAMGSATAELGICTLDNNTIIIVPRVHNPGLCVMYS